MTIFLIMVIALCFWGIQYKQGKNEYIASPLAADHVLALRGIMAIEIVLGHTYGSVPNSQLLYLNSRIGVWSVGIFFLLSGYGLMKSLHKKENYLQGFLGKRVGAIVLPFICMFLLEQIINAGDFFDRLVRYFYRDWFVCEIIVIYLLWYILYKYVAEKYAFAIFAILILVLNIVGVLTGIGSRWYGSTACFLVGIFVEKYETEITDIFSKKYWQFLIATGIGFLSFAVIFILNSQDAILSAGCINITCILLCLLVVLFLMKFSLGNALTEFCGKISWEIYVTHRLCIQYIGKLPISNTFLIMSLLLVGIVTLSYILHRFCGAIKRGTCSLHRAGKIVK